MAIKTKRVKHGDAIVRGIKVTKNNVHALVEWIKNAGATAEGVYEIKNGSINDRVRIKTLRGWRVAQIGDIIVRGSDNHVFGVMKAVDFQGYLKPKYPTSIDK